MEGVALNLTHSLNALFDWFRREGVAYPWGEDPSPYRVWISEIMLQQTVVTAVVPFFHRWMGRFPGVEELASAAEEEVLRLWEGLGYYSRARNIRRAALSITDRGGFPDTYEGWKALPGVGDYTARAVLSQAFGRPLGVLDANVKRIVQRLAVQEIFDPAFAENAQAALDEAAGNSGDPGLFNGALMQLGQLVCRKKNPECSWCPLNPDCSARRQGRQNEIPPVRQRQVTEKETEVWLLVRRGGQGAAPGQAGLRVLLSRREGEVLGHLWTFLRRPRGRFQQRLAGQPGITLKGQLKNRTHSYTRYRDRLSPLVIEVQGGQVCHLSSQRELQDSLPPWMEGEEGESLQWVDREELAALPLPAVYRKIAQEWLELEEA